MHASPEALRLDPPLGHGMVLQRDTDVRLSGRDRPGQSILVTFRGRSSSTLTNAHGHWSVAHPSGPAGGPFALVVQGSTEQILHQVLVGEVWLASGQSNMQWQLRQCGPAQADMAAADFPTLRFMTVPTVATATPRHEIQADWQTVTPATVPTMSAVAFYFARRLQANLKVPVGMIIAAWGGTPAETWTPRPAFALNATTRRLWADYERDAALPHESPEAAQQRIKEWEQTHLPADPGNHALAQGWANADFEDSAWPTMSLPRMWQTIPTMKFNGVVWFRRTIQLPDSWRDQALQLELGPLDDCDDTYVNGTRVGGLDRSVADSFRTPRLYRIPPQLTQAGHITIAVRVYDFFGLGGFAGTAAQMRLSRPGAANRAIPLSGDWRYRTEHQFPTLPPDLFQTRPCLPTGQIPENLPSQVFNGMIHPLTGTSLRGVIWYQGESNEGRPGDYADLFRALIEGWRSAFQRPNLPFLFVQLPNLCGGATWPLLREAQAAALDLPATAMAVTLDVGDSTDIHPQHKQPVGERLADLALHEVYALLGHPHSPTVQHVRALGETLHVSFHQAGQGLRTTDGQPPRAFELCGADGAYHPAEAVIEGCGVSLSHPALAKPCGVRYAFAADPAVNLVNAEGLPAAPFRMDSL